ncbi:hypothetical protein [Saliphagus infecundisoli]|uniref:Uncharacterized protein n=1 Tax=Saliphagus infecundisoli TaxID=1849069 RepID=A0ABD5QID9_9EURY|nr:hypothetical protein [Saliphagus infecundisoli]
MATLEELYEAVDELSLDELQDLNKYVVERMRGKRNAIQSEKMPRFSEGETVKVVEDDEIKFTGRIAKKKRTHVIIDTGDVEYDVPILLVEKQND